MEENKTKKLYDIDAYATTFEARVLSCEEIKRQEEPNAESIFAVVLDQTLFFPEEGGQTPDKGMLGDAEVIDVQIKNDVITHYVTKWLQSDGCICGEINWQHRFFNMQQHSGEHLFSG